MTEVEMFHNASEQIQEVQHLLNVAFSLLLISMIVLFSGVMVWLYNERQSNKIMRIEIEALKKLLPLLNGATNTVADHASKFLAQKVLNEKFEGFIKETMNLNHSKASIYTEFEESINFLKSAMTGMKTLRAKDRDLHQEHLARIREELFKVRARQRIFRDALLPKQIHITTFDQKATAKLNQEWKDKCASIAKQVDDFDNGSV